MQQHPKRKKPKQEYTTEEWSKMVANLEDENKSLKALIGDILKMLEKKL